MMTFTVREPFAERATQWDGLAEHRGWRIKRYAICYRAPLEPARFAPALDLAWAALPQPAITDGRPGVAIAICHQGNGADYLVLAWWDRENELPLRIWVRDGAGWRPARAGESVCVWDLALLGAEREAYVREMLKPGGPDLARYLAFQAGGKR